MTLTLAITAHSAISASSMECFLNSFPIKTRNKQGGWEKPLGGLRNGISTLNFLDWKDGNTVFDSIAAQTGSSMTVSGIEEPVQIRPGQVSASSFNVFETRAAIGRLGLAG